MYNILILTILCTKIRTLTNISTRQLCQRDASKTKQLTVSMCSNSNNKLWSSCAHTQTHHIVLRITEKTLRSGLCDLTLAGIGKQVKEMNRVIADI